MKEKDEEDNEIQIEKTFNKHFMISAGSGITPMHQIIKYAQQNKESLNKFALIFANKSNEDILLIEALNALKAQGL
jgi:ferredoxin-NADP reductase